MQNHPYSRPDMREDDDRVSCLGNLENFQRAYEGLLKAGSLRWVAFGHRQTCEMDWRAGLADIWDGRAYKQKFFQCSKSHSPLGRECFCWVLFWMIKHVRWLLAAFLFKKFLTGWAHLERTVPPNFARGNAAAAAMDVALRRLDHF